MNLHVIDVSNFVYGATLSTQLPARHVCGIPVTGIKYLMQQITRALIIHDDYILCFDNKENFRKKVYSGYKAHRTYHPEVAVQLDIIYEFLSAIGFTCLRVPGYEADDLVHSVIKAHEPFSTCSYPTITIYSGDRDLAHNVYNSKIRLEPTLGGGTFVTNSNFESALSKDRVRIPSNVISVYKTIYGDKSDNIPSFKTPSIYNRYLQDICGGKVYYPPEKTIDPNLTLNYYKLLLKNKIITVEDLAFLERNIQLVYPVDLYCKGGSSVSPLFLKSFYTLYKDSAEFMKYMNENNLDSSALQSILQYYCNSSHKINHHRFQEVSNYDKIDKEKLVEFLSILGDIKSLRAIGRKPLEDISQHDIYNVFSQWASRYRKGEYVIDTEGSAIVESGAFSEVFTEHKLF